MAREWSERILQGERGLVSHFLLDAGWYDPASIFRPAKSTGGPEDGDLAELGREFGRLGFQLGLWFSLNGPIGIDLSWAKAQGYRISNQGCGGGYNCAGGRTSFLCLTDRRWERDLTARLEELIAQVPVSFFKDDWDNDGIEDPLFDQTAPAESQREANIDMMLRVYQRMHEANRDLAIRGAWWLSPWWFAHVDNTHLPNSGDMEMSDLPCLTPRDSSLTCRDAIYYKVMVECRTPIAYDVICNHEFASAPRNPVQDTESSWMNCLAMWVSRGSHYLQLYLAPYGLQEWKAWSVREMLRWFRQHEWLLWKGGTRFVGGNPGRGEVYGYHHESEGREALTIRNPMASPQRWSEEILAELGASDWVQIYPCYRPICLLPEWLASHEVAIFTRGLYASPSQTSIYTVSGWKTVLSDSAVCEDRVPPLHQLPDPFMKMIRVSDREIRFEGVLPYCLESAEVVLRLRTDPSVPGAFLVSSGRYADGAASASIPVTICRPHSRIGFAQSRLGLGPSDADITILRFAIGTGGTVNTFLSSSAPFTTEIEAWVEGCPWSLPYEGVGLPDSFPPATTQNRQVILQVS
jgi:hypothetical protein